MGHAMARLTFPAAAARKSRTTEVRTRLLNDKRRLLNDKPQRFDRVEYSLHALEGAQSIEGKKVARSTLQMCSARVAETLVDLEHHAQRLASVLLHRHLEVAPRLVHAHRRLGPPHHKINTPTTTTGLSTRYMSMPPTDNTHN